MKNGKLFCTHWKMNTSKCFRKSLLPIPCNATLFFEHFSEKMKTLGYHIYYETFLFSEEQDEDYYDYDFSSIFDPFYGFEEEDYEEYFHIKKKK